MANRFKNAPVVETVKPKTKGGASMPEIKIKGVEPHAALKMVLDVLTTVFKTQEDKLKDGPVADVFVREGLALKRKPESFKATEGNARTTCMWNKRSVTSVLSDEEVELLDQAGVPYGTIEDQVETYIFNPAYANDSTLLAKISKALDKVPGLPEDLIMKQEGKTRRVVTEETQNVLFTKGDNLVKMLFRPCGTLALRSKFNGEISEAFAIVEKVVADAQKAETV